jgi:cell division protein FtsQ
MTARKEISPVEQSPGGRRAFAGMITVIIVIVLCWVGALQWKDRSSITSVVVEGEHILSSSKIIQLAHLQQNAGMYDIDLTVIGENIRKNPFIKNVVVQRDAPSTLRIMVTERTPAAMIVRNGSSDPLYIDSQGYILPRVDSEALFDVPVITGVDSTVVVGQQTTQADIVGALQVLQAAHDVGDDVLHMISEIRIRDGHDMILYSSDNGIPIIFGRGDAVKKMVELDAFWKKFVLPQGAQNIQYIDLRFDDQVIVANKNQTS